MIKIKFIKQFEEMKEGQVVECSKKNADRWIKNGYAEYVEESKKKVIKKNTINIPERISNFNFVLIGGDGKQPIEKGWQKKIHKIDCPIFQQHISEGKNYGVQSNNSSIVIDKETYFLIMIDFDTKKFQDKVINLFPETFTTTSGSDKKCVHLWFASDNNKAFKIKDENLKTLADLIGSGNQIIAPGSKHSSGSIYSVVKDIPIIFIPYSEIEAILKPYDKSPKKIKKLKKQFIPKGVSSNIGEEILNYISMDEVLSEIGIDTSKNPTECFLHGSNGGKCFSFTDEVAHCFHCDNSWNKYSLIREAKNLIDKETFEWFAEKSGRSEELKKSRKEYQEQKKEEVSKESIIFSRRGQIETFWKKQPFFYDKSKIFYLWDEKLKKWSLSDEVDFLNKIQQILGIETIDSKARIELVEGFKQIGRLHHPKPIKKTWVQFKNKIYDIKTGEEFIATPKYFVTNPIPWEIGDSEDTPTIDKYYDEWVGEENKQSLYEFNAYNITQDKFMQRLWAFCGGGSNGKGSCIKLNYKFIGEDNCVSSDLKALSEDKFETAILHKKLLCVMGEISYSDLRNTNKIKKIAGEDKLSFQFKGKTPFTDDNTATAVILTNSLPITPDRSLGFYRKIHIIDFPNQFKELKHDLIAIIPNIEFNNLAKKCLRILKELYETQKFYNEGDFEERIKRYEERSNPVMRFFEDHFEEVEGEYIALRNFTNQCNEYLKNKHLRVITPIQVGRILRNEGFSVGARKINDVTSTVILNIKPLEPLEPSKYETIPYKGVIRDHAGSSGLSGYLDKEENFPQETKE